MIKSKLSVMVAALLLAVVFACPLYAAEYKNAEYGFSVNYPDACEKQAPIKGTIFYAIASTKMPWFTVAVAEGTAFDTTLKSAYTGNTDISAIEVKPAKEVVTDSGVKALAAPMKYMWQETYECEGVTLGVQKNGKWIIVTLMTVPMYDSSFSPESYEKMLKSLKFN